MSTLAAIRSVRRFERTKAVVFFIILTTGLVLLLWKTPVKLPNTRAVADLVASYTPLVNLALTLLLVTITGFYAWVTYQMATQLADARRSAIRPLLWVHAGDIELSGDPDTKERRITTKFQVWNFGSGAALATKFECSAIYETEKEHTFINADVEPQPPPVLAAGSSHDGVWSIYGFPTDISTSRGDFLEGRLRCQDTEGNLYELLATFDLHVLDATHRYWRRRTEALYFLPFRLRKSLRESGAVLGPVTKYVQLYERSFW